MLPEGLLAARLLLALVFGIAGIAKVLDPAGSRVGLRQFGVPEWLVRPLALGLPLVEVSIAVSLVPNASARWAGLGGLGLLCLFVTGIGLNLARGRHPDCHCFGQLHSAPIGWPTLTRNGLLVGAAGLVAWQGPGLDAGSWLGTMTPIGWVAVAADVLVIGVVLLEGWFILNLTSQQGRLLLRLEALEGSTGTDRSANGAAVSAAQAVLPIGSPAPDFQLSGVLGETHTLRALLASGRPLMLVFSDPDCGPCNALLPELGRWQREQANELNIALVSRGDIDANLGKAREHGLGQVLLQKNREVATVYHYKGTPSAVLIGADGLIASLVVAGAEAIRALVAQGVGGAIAPRQAAQLAVAPSNGRTGARAQAHVDALIQVGQPAPALSLPDLEDNAVELAQFRGHSTMVLFWNPGCGFLSEDAR